MDIDTRLLEDFWGLSFQEGFCNFFFTAFFSLESFLGFSIKDLFFPFLAYIFNQYFIFLFFFFFFLPGLESKGGSWALDSFEMFTSCLCRMRGRSLMFPSGPAPMEQEVEVEVDGGLLLVPRQAAASPVVWASPAFLFRLVLSLALLVFPCPAVAARVSSSLSTTHHVHHFHNKHGTVPIAINRMPFLTRGGHGKTRCYFLLFFLACPGTDHPMIDQQFC